MTSPKLRFIKYLGQGGFGTVFLAKTKDNKDVVVKKSKLNGKLQMKAVQREVAFLSTCCHPNIISFIGFFMDLEDFTGNIVMEYASGGSLAHSIMNRRRSGRYYRQSTIMTYFCEILLGVHYLHVNMITHRDLKPANILISAYGHLKLADFGISKFCWSHQKLKTITGTEEYMAPEIRGRESYDKSCDIWSLGVIFYELCMLHLPFPKNPSGRRGAIFKIANIFPSGYQLICDLMLQLAPEKRATSAKIISHNYLDRCLYDLTYNYK